MSTEEGKRNSHSQIPSRGKEGTWIPACQDTGGCPEPRSTFPPRYQLFSLTELVMNMVFLHGNNEILDVTSRTNQMCPHRPGKGRPFLSKWCPEVEQNSYIWLFCSPLEGQCVVIEKKKESLGAPLVVQWLRLQAPSTGGHPWLGNQIPHAATKGSTCQNSDPVSVCYVASVVSSSV